jgi:WD40 repeat protein
VDELVRWDEEHDDDSDEPEGWGKSSVGALDVDVGGRIITGGDDGSVRVWDACGR